MKNYYLIVRYRDNNEVQAVELNSKWYLDGCKSDIFLKANFLEAIDLITTKFKNREEMLKRMKENGYIRSCNADVFIASKRIINRKEELNCCEVIYNTKNNSRVVELRNIAKASLNNNMSVENLKIKKIFDKLVNKFFYDNEFRNYLKSSFSNIYKILVEMNFWTPGSAKPVYNAKYGNNWVLSSYFVIRSIIDAMNRYDFYYNVDGILDANYLSENEIERKQVENELLVKLDKNYIEGQCNLLDLGIIRNNTITNENDAPDIEELEENSDNLENETYKELSINEKRTFIYETIRSLPIATFNYIDDRVVINESLFKVYPSARDRNVFLKLSVKIRKIMLSYVLHYDKYREALNNFQSTTSLEEEIRKDGSRLKKLLANNKTVDRIYEWCNVYLRCLEFEKLTRDFQTVTDWEEGIKIGKRH